MSNIAVSDLKMMMDNGDELTLLDVRETHEIAQAAIDPHVNIPMSLLPIRVNELDPDKHTAVICLTGSRSYQVAKWLEQNGFANVSNVVGGISAWAQQIDPNIVSR